MKRCHLIEIEDQAWCPRAVRDGITDFLQFTLAASRSYDAIQPVLAVTLRRVSSRRVIDLCSGAAGPWLSLQPELARSGLDVSVCLTDMYPNLGAFELFKDATDHAITYCPQPVDAAQVPGELTGFRTMFTAFHHFHPEKASRVLADAIGKREGIAVFEATERSVRGLLLMLLAPLMLVLAAPFIRPFRWSRLLWTYVIPLIPAVILFDGMVSCLRTYRLEELQALAAGLNAKDYHWETGAVQSNRSLIPITYLVGVPITRG